MHVPAVDHELVRRLLVDKYKCSLLQLITMHVELLCSTYKALWLFWYEYKPSDLKVSSLKKLFKLLNKLPDGPIAKMLLRTYSNCVPKFMFLSQKAQFHHIMPPICSTVMYVLNCIDKSTCSNIEQTEAELVGNTTFRHSYIRI